MFLSGGHAEAKAHELALLDSRAGVVARVLIHDRRRRLVGEREYPALQTPDPDQSRIGGERSG